MRGVSLLFAALVACVSVLVSCGKETPEQAIVAQLQRAEEAIVARDIQTYKHTMTSESWADHEETLRLAREANEAQTKALPPTRMRAVVALRNRLPVARLKTMTADDYAIWRIDEGMLYPLSDMGIFPHKITIRGDAADVQMGAEEVEQNSRTIRIRRRGGAARALGAAINLAVASQNKNLVPIEGLVLHYKNLNGYWYRDNDPGRSYWDDNYVQVAKEANMTVPEFIAELESDDMGEIKDDIWNPQK